jgi:UDPglucose 6-dehydrogenase
LDLNEERIAAWNDENLDNIQFTNRVYREIVKQARNLFSTDVEKAIDETHFYINVRLRNLLIKGKNEAD